MFVSSSELRPERVAVDYSARTVHWFGFYSDINFVVRVEKLGCSKAALTSEEEFPLPLPIYSVK